jgi:hypothetical protein
MNTSTAVKNKYLVLVLCILTVGVISWISYNNRQRQIEVRQAYIHERGATVMPFDLNRTTHSFTKTAEGGLQQIKVKNPQDTEQIQLIRTHLKKEAALFAQGNFADPATLHGNAMPGLSILQDSKGKLKVEFADLPDGAQITYVTNNQEVIDAVHLWFMAQLQDHGKDAMEHM